MSSIRPIALRQSIGVGEDGGDGPGDVGEDGGDGPGDVGEDGGDGPGDVGEDEVSLTVSSSVEYDEMVTAELPVQGPGVQSVELAAPASWVIKPSW